MYPKSVQKLIEFFAKLPGVGPRAAGRYVFALLKEEPQFVKEFGITLANLPSTVGICSECCMSIEQEKENITGYNVTPSLGRNVNKAPISLLARRNKNLCAFCANKNRNRTVVMVVEKESDLATVEKTGMFQGLYHVLGGTLSPLDNDSAKKIKIRELYNRVAEQKKSLPDLEVILATNPTLEGDVTANYIERILEPLKVKLTRLGRGITAGSELEYLDDTTVMHALKNRK